jgi:membrane peptidoglycan carboxypeptidase
MDLINPNSLIRKKGNLKIRLTVDLPLQRELEKLVNNRGYGPDTTIMDEVRIGSKGEQVKLSYVPKDTLRHIRVLTKQKIVMNPAPLSFVSMSVTRECKTV